MKIIKIVVGKLHTNSYLLIDEETRDAAIVDPGFNSDGIINEIEMAKCNLKYVMFTHAHFDHVFEAQQIKDKYNAVYLMHETSKEVISDARYNLASSFLKKELDLKVDDNDIFIKDNDEFNIGKSKIKAIHIGGHTIDSTAFYIEDDKVLISGDTLFNSSIGRTDFFGGNHKKLVENIKGKILTLDDDVLVLPGHGFETYIASEKENNEELI